MNISLYSRTVGPLEESRDQIKKENEMKGVNNFLNFRILEIHKFYNLQLFYWHFLEILWLFIFLVFYCCYYSSQAY